MALAKPAACAAESATVTVFALTLRVQRQPPEWLGPTEPSLSQSNAATSDLQRSNLALSAAIFAAESAENFGGFFLVFMVRIYTYM